MFFWVALLGFFMGCADKSEECFQDSDCEAGEECVIEHDHEGDDHSHGGTCVRVDDTAQ